MALDLTNITVILNQIPDILVPIPNILIALTEVVLYGVIIGLTIAIVHSLWKYIKKLLKM